MSLVIETLNLGELGTNCYLAWDDESEEGIIIDPADEGDFISLKITELGLNPQAIILTHGHFDHVLGLLEVKLNFKIPVYLHPADLPLFRTARSSARHWLKKDPGPIPPVDRQLKDGQKISFGKQIFEVIWTPGHTKGSIALTNGLSVVFTGDTLFNGSVGRTDFSYSDPKELRSSVKRILALPGWCKIYPGHGETSTISAESLDVPS
jgi:glyoxylase-like metal-dependent hydrolase (beta-lactamase superfamily II)